MQLVAPAIAFGQAVAALGNWFAQQDYGHPSSLPWAVAISPAHRPAGYENFATFEPMFLYQGLLAVTTGAAVVWAAKRFSLPGERVFALQAAATPRATAPGKPMTSPPVRMSSHGVWRARGR